MSKLSFSVTPLSVTDKICFTEATAEELRVLIALIECGGEAESEKALADMAKTSKARCISALALWQAEGVITTRDREATIVEEFEQRIYSGELDEERSLDTARSIRDENLAEMLEECATIMQLGSLSPNDVKNISGLYTQYGLTPEYVVTLAAHMAKDGRLTSVKLKNKAIKLSNDGCSSYEELIDYIDYKENQPKESMEYRRVLGTTYGRNLTPTEKKFFKKWAEVYGYSAKIVAEAFDIAVMNTGGKASLAYIDKVLEGWHTAGCKTVAECRAQNEAGRVAAKGNGNPKRRAGAEPKPRYGDFDVDDAFKRALERSFSDNED